MPKDFELLPHTADLKIRAYGATLQELFTHALIGMFNAMGPQAVGCSYKNDRFSCDAWPITRAVDIRAADEVSLLVDFLSYALYLSDAYNEAYGTVTITTLTNDHIIAQLHGMHVTGFTESEIKAVTYHNLAIQEDHGILHADIVFDI
jgi:SHS2 domain-containing protein